MDFSNAKSMRFLFVIESLAVSCGGPARVAAAVAGGLNKRGHKVTICFSDSVHKKINISNGILLKDTPSRIVKPTNIFRAASTIETLSRESDAVIVSGIWGPLDGIALRMSRADRSKVFIRPCGMLEEYILQKNPWKKRFARLLYVDHNLRNAKALLPNTIIESQNLKAAGVSSPSIIIPNGVVLPDQDSFTSEQARVNIGVHQQGCDHFLLYIGRIDKKKGLDLLLAGFAMFSRKYPNWGLIVAGMYTDTEFESQIKKQLINVRNRNVFFVGEVDGVIKDSCFRASNAFILPSHSEGFPNAAIEAMSWKLAVILTKGCNFPEAVSNNAGVETLLTEESIAETLCNVLPNSNRLHEMGQNGAALVSNIYTLDSVLDSYESLAKGTGGVIPVDNPSL